MTTLQPSWREHPCLGSAHAPGAAADESHLVFQSHFVDTSLLWLLSQLRQLLAEPDDFGFSGATSILALNAGRLSLLVGPEPFAGRRVVEPQFQRRRYTDFQFQYGAVAAQVSRVVRDEGLLPVFCPFQRFHYESRREVVSGGVKAHVLRDAHVSVDAPLFGGIPPPGAGKRQSP